MTYRLEVVPADVWAGLVARAWASRIESRPDLRMCLPTGSTPRPLYRAVAALADFSQATVFVLDEFGLPPDDPARCDWVLRTDLVDRLDPPLQRFDSLDPAAADLDEECRRYSAAVADGGLHLTLLGLGRNGHLGLNEPGSAPDSTTRVVDLAPETTESLKGYGAAAETGWGMTLGMSEILFSEEVWLLVRGGQKRGILAKALEEAPSPALPATYLREHPNVVIWADEAAASGL